MKEGRKRKDTFVIKTRREINLGKRGRRRKKKGNKRKRVKIMLKSRVVNGWGKYA
jgi:hypothetical protein